MALQLQATVNRSIAVFKRFADNVAPKLGQLDDNDIRVG